MRAAWMLALVAACGSGKTATSARDAGAPAQGSGATRALVRAPIEWRQRERRVYLPPLPPTRRLAPARADLVVTVGGDGDVAAFRDGACRGLAAIGLTCADNATMSLDVHLSADGDALDVEMEGLHPLNEGWEAVRIGLTLEADVAADRYADAGEAAIARWRNAVDERIAEVSTSPIRWFVAPANHHRTFEGSIGGRARTYQGVPSFTERLAGDTTWSLVSVDDATVAWPITGDGEIGAPIRWASRLQPQRPPVGESGARVLISVWGLVTFDGDTTLPAVSETSKTLSVVALGDGTATVAARVDGVFPLGAPADGADGAIYVVTGIDDAHGVVRLEANAVARTWKVGHALPYPTLRWLDPEHLAVWDDEASVIDVRKGGAPRALGAAVSLAADGHGGAIVLQTHTRLARIDRAGKVTWKVTLDAPFLEVAVAGDRILLFGDDSTTPSQLRAVGDGAVVVRRGPRSSAITALRDGTVVVCSATELIALQDDRELGRIPTAGLCDGIFERDDGTLIVAMYGQVMGVGPPTSW